MYGNPYYTQPPRYQSMGMATQPMPTQNYIQPIQQAPAQVGLQGKTVESIEVVKAMDIPLDGSISFFPLSDGSAIVTKQLQTDGTSKTVIFRPTEENKKEVPQYVTFDDMKTEISKIDLSELEDIKEELREIKKQIKDIRKNKEA